MLKIILFSLFALGFAGQSYAQSAPAPVVANLADHCRTEMAGLIGPYDKKQLDPVCAKAEVLDICKSKDGTPIFHFDKAGVGNPKNPTEKIKRVLALSLIHGDENPAGGVTRAWMTRLNTIDPRNTWRVIPIMNPDGLKAHTRTNAAGVDLNRNFPSKDWDQNSIKYWKNDRHSDPRRYPGPSGASEIETQCLIKHLDEFKPDFVISIHTPLGVLDFDGPPIGNPGFKPLPWVSLGNYPGSLGRYMWVDRKVPVLTIELRGNSGLQKLEEFDRLQDITGTVAIQADKINKKEKDVKKKEKDAKPKNSPRVAKEGTD